LKPYGVLQEGSLPFAGMLYAADVGRSQQQGDTTLPAELRRLHSLTGLRSFVQTPIGPSARPLGALLLGKRDADAFSAVW